MLETRILQSEKRNIVASNVEIRVGESQIYICGSLPICSLSHPITDRKRNVKFRELVEPRAFKLALLKNKAYNYKTKLLKNHNHDLEFLYDKLEFDEISERELRFEFNLPKTEKNLELLKDISEDNASFSFGFIAGTTREKPSNEAGIAYIRRIESFQRLIEISILDVFTEGAYPKAKGFTSDSLQKGINKAEKFVLEKNRERQCERDEKKLKELKKYIVKQRNNEIINQLAGYRRVTKF